VAGADLHGGAVDKASIAVAPLSLMGSTVRPIAELSAVMLPGVGVAVAELSHAISEASISMPMKISDHHSSVI